MDKMDCFDTMNVMSGVKHSDDNGDLPALSGDESDNELLDYMVLVLTRTLPGAKAFKGGYMLNQLLGVNSRMTHDIDFSVGDAKVYEDVKRILTNVAEEFKRLGIVNQYAIKEEIKPTMSGGIDFYNKDGRKFLGVDVGLHDISWGIKQYDFSIVTLDGFEIERMLADKLIAILSRKRFRRTKDLYDFYMITSTFDFDGTKLAKYVEIRGGAKWDNIPFNEDVIVQYARAWDKLSLVNLNGDKLEKPDFNSCIQRYYTVALPMKDKRSFTKWNHVKMFLED